MTARSSHKNAPGPASGRGPTSMEVTHPMRPPNATCDREARVDGPVRTRHTLVVCVVCGHERIDTPRQETSCPECGATARRSFALFLDLREER
jgi:hypothetical protein